MPTKAKRRGGQSKPNVIDFAAAQLNGLARTRIVDFSLDVHSDVHEIQRRCAGLPR